MVVIFPDFILLWKENVSLYVLTILGYSLIYHGVLVVLGDLHPGNVFINGKEKKFVLFDVGIVAEYTEEDHTTMVDILTSLIRGQGRQAGRLMIDSANRIMRESDDHVRDEELFIDKIAEMNHKAMQKGYLMQKLGVYITLICNAAAEHHVMTNQAFISAALAVKVQEGIALALDPSIEIWRVALPIIFESERRRGLVQRQVKKFFNSRNNASDNTKSSAKM